jgi:hypothetical protein
MFRTPCPSSFGLAPGEGAQVYQHLHGERLGSTSQNLRTLLGNGTVLAGLLNGNSVELLEDANNWACVCDIDTGCMGWVYRPYSLYPCDIE